MAGTDDDVELRSIEYVKGTRATAAAPLDALRLAINSCKDVTKLGRFSPSVDPVRWVAQLQAHLESALNAATPAQPETPLHWPFAAKHENCAECSREYEPPPKQDEASDAPEPPDPAAKVPSDLIAWKWANTLSQSEQDVLLGSSVRRLQEAITTALRAERERAARIAEAMAMGETYETGRQKAINIAAAIRSKESSDGE